MDRAGGGFLGGWSFETVQEMQFRGLGAALECSDIAAIVGVVDVRDIDDPQTRQRVAKQSLIV